MINLNKLRLKSSVIITYIALLLIAGLASVVSSYVIKQTKINVNQTPAPVEKPSLYPDYDAIKGKNPDPQIDVVKFTSNCPENGCVNNKRAVNDFDGIKRSYTVRGKFSRAYLYIEAAVDYNRPLTSWDDFFFMFENYNWGGHLLTDENLLPVPPGDISKYLYNLKSVSYFVLGKGGNKITFRDINFFALLQSGITFDVRATVASDRPGRVLKEVSIYYQCLENSECSIEEVK